MSELSSAPDTLKVKQRRLKKGRESKMNFVKKEEAWFIVLISVIHYKYALFSLQNKMLLEEYACPPYSDVWTINGSQKPLWWTHFNFQPVEPFILFIKGSWISMQEPFGVKDSFLMVHNSHIRQDRIWLFLRHFFLKNLLAWC